jgi:hypothetical protein
LSFELDGQMAAPDFDLELNLHRAFTKRLIECAWKLGSKGKKIFIDSGPPSHGSLLDHPALNR